MAKRRISSEITRSTSLKDTPIQLQSLTSLRFFAALFVVLAHTSPPWPHFAITLKLSQFGNLGVTFFFILSGFVLTYSQNISTRKISYKRFLRNRFARIYPLHVLFLLLTVVTLLIYRANPAGYPGLSIWKVVANIFVVHDWIPLHPEFRQGLNGVSWTLSIELFFYLIFVPLYRFFIRRSLQQMLVIFSCLYLIYGVTLEIANLTHSLSLQDLLYFYPPFRLPEFVLGMTLAFYLQSGKRVFFHKVPPFLFTVILITALLLWSSLVHIQSQFTAETNFIALPLFGLIIFSHSNAEMNSRSGVLQSRLLVQLGEESYALYISHALLLGIFATELHRMNSTILKPASGEVVTFIFILGAMGLARLLHTAIEVPIRNALRSK